MMNSQKPLDIEQSRQEAKKALAKSGIVNSLNYQDIAQLTESMPDEAMGCRFAERDTAEHLYTVMLSCIWLADSLDKLKKYLFYGKDYNASDLFVGEVKPVPVTEEVSNRLSEEKTQRLMHAAIGLITEAGEFAEPIFNYAFRGIEYDPVNLLEEIGDGIWYAMIPINVFGETFDTVLKVNADKLNNKRYKGGLFNALYANNRDLDGERQLLMDGFFASEVQGQVENADPHGDPKIQTENQDTGN